MVSWPSIMNSELRPYIEAAAKGDWFSPLRNLVLETDIKKLESLKKKLDQIVEDWGFALHDSIKEQNLFYLNRVRSLVNRQLLKVGQI